jgi:hypothetical protein
LIRRIAVESTELATVGYDPMMSMLEAEFRSGEVYRYYGVPAQVYLNLLDAPSKGRYFNAHIRSSYKHDRLRWAA